MKRLLFTIILITIASVATAASNHPCRYCDKPITDSVYIKAGGWFFHADHFICEICGKPITDEHFCRNDQKFYHCPCYNELFAPHCAICDSIIVNTFIRANDTVYHRSCYSDSFAVHCDICGKEIQGEFIIDFWGNQVCAKHADEFPECEYCRRLICDKLTGGGVRYADGRTTCDLCRATAVKDNENANRILATARSGLADNGIYVNLTDVTVLLVGKDELLERSKIPGENLRGYTYTVRIYNHAGDVVNKTYNIYILDGMPYMHYLVTLAHELMHVWLRENANELMDKDLTEGSCNFAAYLVIKDMPGKEAEYIVASKTADPDPIYGEGFRLVKDMVDKNGIAAWLEYLKHNQSFPEP